MTDNVLNIKRVYSRYFEIIDEFFGSIKHHLKDHEESHIDLGVQIGNYPLISDLILDAIDDLDIEIEKFWNENEHGIFDFIKKQNTLKCIYSGDITPVLLENFVKKAALYVDTIIIADPILNMSRFQKAMTLDRKYYLNKLVRHVFNVWKLRDLMLADAETNILLILPINIYLINAKNRDTLLERANGGFSKYISDIYGPELSKAEECLSFLEGFSSGATLYSKIKNHGILPNAFKEKKGFYDFLSDLGNAWVHTEFGGKPPGWNFAHYIRSQFIRVQEHKLFCEILTAEPIYDNELAWFFLNYEIGGLDMDASIANALQKEQFEWITKVPISALKVLREKNRLDYMRSVLRTGITSRSDSDLSQVAEQLERNLSDAFKRQKSELKSLKDEVRDITAKEIPITSGGFLAGFIPYLGNIVSIITAGRDVKNLIQRRQEVKQEIGDKENDFINLLIKAHDEK